MKIKCFDATELPILEWQDNCGSSTEVFCWPVASDFSLRASIAYIHHSSFLKQYSEGERFSISLDDGDLYLTDKLQAQQSIKHIGDTFRSQAYQCVELDLQGQPVRLLNLIFNPDRWSVKSRIVTKEHRLPIGQAGLVFVLSGEWGVSGANCKTMRVNQGGWWLPDIGEGVITPQITGSKLIWVEITPC
ncbi:HutD family protein [Providencia burhodogranariea]|uniref:Various environmental stresses-induced protein n=1 Tax=Providencia burhodogranariea DSM 19968 TaxID=1141662 RepID=K8X207_9GAMM|nr:HutD family protein [Providencia burhodogranariea]EKT62510.1 hypothetical protein OOA_06873 [Providencia burhodogranariea DSM 19968]